jgi:heme exporter protein C
MTAVRTTRGTGTVVTMTLGIAAVASLAATYAVGLSLPPTYEQGDYSKLIAVHPGLAWASYVAFGVTALASALWLWPRTRSLSWDLLAGASAEVGAVFTALTLVTGSIWGRPTWGVWWVWDARLTLSALELMLLLGYLALRRVPAASEVRARRSALAALLAVLVVPVNHFAVEWWRTLHQEGSLDLTPEDSLDGKFVVAMILGFLAMTLVYAWLTAHRYRLAQREEELVADDLDAALEARRREAVGA